MNTELEMLGKYIRNCHATKTYKIYRMIMSYVNYRTEQMQLQNRTNKVCTFTCHKSECQNYTIVSLILNKVLNQSCFLISTSSVMFQILIFLCILYPKLHGNKPEMFNHEVTSSVKTDISMAFNSISRDITHLLEYHFIPQPRNALDVTTTLIGQGVLEQPTVQQGHDVTGLESATCALTTMCDVGYERLF